MRTTDETLKRLAELDKAATPGTWGFSGTFGWRLKNGDFSIDDSKETVICSRAAYEDKAEEMLANADLIVAARDAIPDLLADIAELKAERDAAIESDRINRHLVARLTVERTQAIIDKEHVEKNLDALVERHANLRASLRSLQDRWEETKTERDKEAGEWSREIGPDGKQVRYEPREAQP